MTYCRAISLALLSLSCGACASTQVHYYTLTPPLAASSALIPACCTVQIKLVTVPPEVNRAEIVTRSGGDQVMVLGNDVWLAPLAAEIRSALGSEVRRRLTTGVPGRPESTVRDFAVWVNITRFDSVPAHSVVVTADWRIHAADASKGASTVCATTVRIAVSGGVPALVLGYQQAIAEIADHIVLDLDKAAVAAAPHCDPESAGNLKIE